MFNFNEEKVAILVLRNSSWSGVGLAAESAWALLVFIDDLVNQCHVGLRVTNHT